MKYLRKKKFLFFQSVAQVTQARARTHPTPKMITALNAGVFTFTSPAVPHYQLVRLGIVTGEFLSFSALDRAVRTTTVLNCWEGHLLLYAHVYSW